MDCKMSTLREHLQECLKDVGFKEEYDALAEEFEKKQRIIDAAKAKIHI